MIVVLDTNVIISALFGRDSVPRQILESVLDERIVLAMSPHLEAELRRVLGYERVQRILRKDWGATELSTFVSHLMSTTWFSPDIPPYRDWIPNDPDDNWVIQCALTAGAPYIITGDKHLLDLNTVEGIVILPPARFLDEVLSKTKQQPRPCQS